MSTKTVNKPSTAQVFGKQTDKPVMISSAAVFGSPEPVKTDGSTKQR